jgi:nitroimidazol reductase NimA-like FMN-containing flavoprotein (pyridoxamine 5'-phosphate oxidase superfamily)
MRRTEREIKDPDELDEVLSAGRYATIAMCQGEEPYVVTLNYGYDRAARALYFHCAREGLKLDVIAQNPTVCGTVVQDRGYIHGKCAHAYRSVVFWGEMRRVDDLDAKKHAMEILLDHLEDNPDPIRRKHLNETSAYERVGILRLDIGRMTGKQGR